MTYAEYEIILLSIYTHKYYERPKDDKKNTWICSMSPFTYIHFLTFMLFSNIS